VAFDDIIQSDDSHLVSHIFAFDAQMRTLREVASIMEIRSIERLRSPSEDLSRQAFSLGNCYISENRRYEGPVDRVWALLRLLPEKPRALVSSAGIVNYNLRARTAYGQSYLAIMKQIALLKPADFFHAITRGQALLNGHCRPRGAQNGTPSDFTNPYNYDILLRDFVRSYQVRGRLNRSLQDL
jgi:hypothetical protein